LISSLISALEGFEIGRIARRNDALVDDDCGIPAWAGVNHVGLEQEVILRHFAIPL
jgi:hypothetical protein